MATKIQFEKSKFSSAPIESKAQIRTLESCLGLPVKELFLNILGDALVVLHSHVDLANLRFDYEEIKNIQHKYGYRGIGLLVDFSDADVYQARYTAPLQGIYEDSCVSFSMSCAYLLFKRKKSKSLIIAYQFDKGTMIKIENVSTKGLQLNSSAKLTFQGVLL